MHVQGLPGFRDFYPDEAALRNHIFSTWRSVATRYGFHEYEGPPLEPLELYVKKSGAEIVGQLYTFEDRGGRAVALRPEMTPTLARMVGARASALKKPIRWFSIPQLLRYERPQRGRLREHYQLNMDILGESSPLADAEIIAATLDIMRAFGLGPADVRARVSDRRIVRALVARQGLSDEQLEGALVHIDKIERESRATLRDRLADTVGIAPEVAERILSIGDIRGMEAVDTALAEVADGAEIGAELRECVDALTAMGLAEFIEVDLGIVRGLAYYTGIVFELFDAQKSLRAICGGGRYDGLLSALGAAPLPAVGFGMGDVVLGELLRSRGLTGNHSPGLDVFLVAVTADDASQVLALAHRLRDAGLQVEYALKPQSVAKQLKLAAARPSRRAVIIGPEERASGEVIVRDMAGGEERRVPIDALATTLDRG